MRTRIVTFVALVLVLAFGVAPAAGAGPIVCGGLRSVGIGFCLDNPLP